MSPNIKARLQHQKQSRQREKHLKNSAEDPRVLLNMNKGQSQIALRQKSVGSDPAKEIQYH